MTNDLKNKSKRTKKAQLLSSSPEVEQNTTSVDTTVKMNVGILRRAQKHAQDLGLTQKKYVEESVRYFYKHGLNPAEEASAEQMSKEIVRLRNHIFSFMQKQEQIYIVPIMQILTRLEHGGDELHGSLERLVEQLEKVYDLMNRIRVLQQASLATQYQLSEADEEFVKKVKQKNDSFITDEISKFSSDKLI